MENTADALKMAGAISLFVLALSVIIFSFGQARENSDIILNYKDRETSYIDGNNYYTTTGTEREVSLETMIPTVYRAFLENYKIVFECLSSPIYKIKNPSGVWIDKYTIDLETQQNPEYPNVSAGNNEDKVEVLKAFLYGDYPVGGKDAFEKKYRISLSGCRPIYEQLKNTSLTEYLGVYYQSDNDNVPDINKKEKRVIIYGAYWRNWIKNRES